jgi:hypothetical protein
MTNIKNKIEKIQNASQKPQVFYCRHMQIGVAAYENETILVEIDAMKRMMPSFMGCPLYVFHVDDIDFENLQETADGYVTDCFYNEKDGWVWAKFVAVSDAAHVAINSGWSVSNAYIPLEWGSGGTWHNVEFNRKIVNGEFTHLAIVPNPRYEDARIYTPEQFKQYQETLTNELNVLHNSKEETKTEVKKMFKLFKNTKQEVSTVDEDTMIELQNGESITVAQMIEAVANAKKNEVEEEKEKMNMDAEIEVGDEKMPLKELVNRYSNMCKKNAEMEVETEDEVENADEEEKANEAEKEEDEKQQKKNDKHFDSLMNAHKNPVQTKKRVNGEKLGAERYGKK